MDKWKRLIYYLMINVLVSACTVLVVLTIWDRLQTPATTGAGEGATTVAASELGVEISEIRLVAAHDWDVTGALRAGCRAAFVARPGMVLGPLAERPDISGRDLREVAEQILRGTHA